MKEEMTYEEYHALTLQAVDEYNNDDYRQALEKFSRLEKANFNNRKIHEVLCYIYLNLGDFRQAQKQYDIYLKLAAEENPHLRLPRSFSEVITECGDMKETETEYTQIMKTEPADSSSVDFEIPIKLCLLYINKGDYKKAEEIISGFKNRFYPHKS
ncbi:MAG TPA: hypothetical protein DC049_07430 [Spirochaetia bacterium]|nr:hypothetical protein [Spirochaetia bacterium]